MLARQLFPDVIQGCYVEGEICDPLNTEPSQKDSLITAVETVSEEQAKCLSDLIGDDVEYTMKLLTFFKIECIEQIPAVQWERILVSGGITESCVLEK